MIGGCIDLGASGRSAGWPWQGRHGGTKLPYSQRAEEAEEETGV